MRAIAEEAFEMVRSYKGSHSGEHGDGLVRSEFHRAMFGDSMVESFEWVKDRMDTVGLLNPNRLVRPPQIDRQRVVQGKSVALRVNHGGHRNIYKKTIQTLTHHNI